MWTEGMAQRLAEAVHAGQTDHAGTPYVEHVAGVAANTKALGGDQFQVMAAWLHDVVEDSVLMVGDLLEMGCPPETVEIVHLMTKRKGQPLTDYYAALRVNPKALLVKQADLMHNTDPARTALLDPETRERLARKYENAHRLLGLPQD